MSIKKEQNMQSVEKPISGGAEIVIIVLAGVTVGMIAFSGLFALEGATAVVSKYFRGRVVYISIEEIIAQYMMVGGCIGFCISLLFHGNSATPVINRRQVVKIVFSCVIGLAMTTALFVIGTVR